MKKITTSLLLLTMLLGACSKGSPATEIKSDQTSTQVISTDMVGSVRQAVISKIEKTVSARKSASEEFAPASEGMSIATGGGLETGSDGRARMDLVPEGTVIRVGPNSSFTLPELVAVDGKPKTTIELLFGNLYVLLKGGSLDVKTSGGVATVRGSVLGVRFDKKLKRLKAACLEGHCALQNEEGKEVELTEGQESFIDSGEPPSDPQQIDRGEIQDWLDQVPEMPDFFQELPNPDNFPEPGLNDGSPATEAPATNVPEPTEAPADGSPNEDNAPNP